MVPGSARQRRPAQYGTDFILVGHGLEVDHLTSIVVNGALPQGLAVPDFHLALERAKAARQAQVKAGQPGLSHQIQVRLYHRPVEEVAGKNFPHQRIAATDKMLKLHSR